MTDLEVRHLTVEFSSGDYVVRALDNLSFYATSGELVLLLGPSGSGKTTLLSCLAGILTPSNGLIVFGETAVTELRGARLNDYRRKTVGIVFQSFNLVPSLTAAENVDSPLRSAGVSARKARARALELLDLVGLSDRAGHRPGDLSGGQQQRVAIARALAFDPPVLLADEPTAHLDYSQVEIVLRILRSLAAPGRLVIVSTHDDRITPLADRVVDLTPDVSGPQRRQRLRLAPGEVVFEEGSRGALIYVIDEGEIDIIRRRADGSEEFLGRYGPKEYFGELGPLLGFPRAGTARARTPAVLTGYTVTEFRERVGADKLDKLLGRAARQQRPRKRTTKPKAKAKPRARTRKR